MDTGSHSVVSFKGDEDTPREYMLSTGMLGSLYESTVWEELTGEESVSTISILAKASEEDIDILLISGANLDTEIEKLNTDEATKQTVINAVNSGKVVTIPAKNITMGDWHGTGYIVTNPETGAGAYMISGGLNGGSTKVILGLKELAVTIITAIAVAALVACIIEILTGVVLVVCVALILAAWLLINYLMWSYYMEYVFEDNLLSKEISETEKDILILYVLMLQGVILPYVKGEETVSETEQGDSNLTEKTGKNLIKNIKKIPHNSNELSRYAIEYRNKNGITNPARNICVAKYINAEGTVEIKAFANKNGMHSEEYMIDFFRENNISGNSVIEIFSEREPCIDTQTNNHNCTKLIIEYAPDAEVSYVVDYGTTPEEGANAREILREILSELLN